MAVDFLWKFRHASETWVERNLLLMNSYWPRQAYLEVIGFHDTPEHRGEMRLGARDDKPALQARAYQWVIADRGVQGGWRPLRFQDLPEVFAGDDCPDVDIPADWPRWALDTSVDETGDWKLWTVDQIALQIDPKNPDSVYAALALEHAAGLKVLEGYLRRLEKLAADPSMARRLRKLTIPEGVSVAIRGPSKDMDNTSEKKAGNKYLVSLEDIKESVRFRVLAVKDLERFKEDKTLGLDFATPYKNVTLVQPPFLNSLEAKMEEPAYIYFRLQGSQTAAQGQEVRLPQTPLAHR